MYKVFGMCMLFHMQNVTQNIDIGMMVLSGDKIRFCHGCVMLLMLLWSEKNTMIVEVEIAAYTVP